MNKTHLLEKEHVAISARNDWYMTKCGIKLHAIHGWRLVKERWLEQWKRGKNCQQAGVAIARYLPDSSHIERLTGRSIMATKEEVIHGIA